MKKVVQPQGQFFLKPDDIACIEFTFCADELFFRFNGPVNDEVMSNQRQFISFEYPFFYHLLMSCYS